MRFRVDLSRCQNQGQCVFAAPEIFALDESGRLSFRDEASDVYVSPDLPPGTDPDLLEEAADVCPMQAITVQY